MFTSKYLYPFFVIALAFVFTNCSEPTGTSFFTSGIIPLETGNTWNYMLTSYDSSNVINYQENKSTTIDKDTIINNQIWFRYNDIPQGLWYTNKQDGYWVFAKAGLPSIQNDTSVLVYKYPTQTGDTYGDWDSPTEVLSTNETITVPAGKFKVIHLKITRPLSTNYLLDSHEIFINPDIGIIKTMQIGKKLDGTKFIVYKKELVSYSLE